MEYSKNLRNLRNAKNKTQNDLANYLNCSHNKYASWEQGRTQPDIDDLIKLSKFFGVSVDYILGREGEDGVIVVSGNELTPAENALIDAVRRLPLESKKVLYAYAEFLMQQQKKPK